MTARETEAVKLVTLSVYELIGTVEAFNDIRKEPLKCAQRTIVSAKERVKALENIKESDGS